LSPLAVLKPPLKTNDTAKDTTRNGQANDGRGEMCVSEDGKK